MQRERVLVGNGRFGNDGCEEYILKQSCRDGWQSSSVVSDVSVICYSTNHKKRHFRNI